jgi:hypothetical protein
LFSALFDFRRTLLLVDQMRKMVASKVSFNAETMPFLEGLQPVLTEWQTIADKFRPQLTKLLLGSDKTRLCERLHAACGYFIPLMKPLAERIANHPCHCKNKADVSDFEPLLSDLFLVLNEKIHLMQSILQTEHPSSESLLQARNTFVAPMMNLQPLMVKSRTSTKGRNTRHQEPEGKALGGKGKAAKNEYKGSGLDDMAVETMIHDMSAEGKPPSFLLDFINMMRRKRVPSKPETSQAGARWTVEDDLRLKEQFLEGTTASQLAKEFNRTNVAIRSRLKRLGLIE